MLKVITIVITVAIVAVLGFAATRPDTLYARHETDIKAPSEEVFALIDGFHRRTVWSPWEKRDPAMKRTYGGSVSGKGANYAWDGSREVGAGRMEIVDSTSPSRIQIQLDFLKPFEAHNTAEFALKPAGDVTHVAWIMHGPSPFISKVVGLFFSMDMMIGKDSGTGLANLKSAA